MLCGMAVLSLYITTWTSSRVLARKLKKYGKMTTNLSFTWRNVHGETLILLVTRFSSPFRAQKPGMPSGYVFKQVDNTINCPYV